MNENINLCEILKDCPKGTEFWSDNFGEVKLINVGTEWDTPIEVELSDGLSYYYTEEGWCNKHLPANCMLWPSKNCRDWSKWQCPKPKFDPKTLKPFDKVLSRYDGGCWSANLFSHIDEDNNKYHGTCSFVCNSSLVKFCIPYNDDTKHLLGTKEEAPYFYRYWED